MAVLKDKTYKSYDYLSRYAAFPYYYHTIDKKYVQGMVSQVNQDTSYTLHEVKPFETFDSIALDYYNNPTFFWVICDFNNIADPFSKLEVGQKLKIPSLNSISFKE